jgi:hypothetical protein
VGRDSEATLVDKWGVRPSSDEPHRDDRPQESSRETPGAGDRFQFATATATVRRRIPLSSVPVVRLEADLPPPARRVAEGSSADLFHFQAFAGTAIPVEVRLRRDPAPSADQVNDLVAWLRAHRVHPSGTPRPLPAPPPIPAPPAALAPAALAPFVHAEPARRGAIWPLFAVSVGLAAAMIAAFVL